MLDIDLSVYTVSCMPVARNFKKGVRAPCDLHGQGSGVLVQNPAI